MIQQGTVSNGLGYLIRSAMSAAVEAGKNEIVTSLQGALRAVEERRPDFELDMLSGEVRRAGQPINLSRGERALLIALALQRRPCTRPTLIELLYSHLEESTAAIQLKVYVHRVRRRLGDPDAIVFKNDAYRLGPNVHVDFWEIEAAIAAAMRSKGMLDPALKTRLNQTRLRLVRRDTSWGRDLEWSVALERRLEAMLFDATARLGEAALGDGDIAAAMRFAAEIFDLDPCDERGAELTMRAHLHAGDRDSALRTYRRYQRALKEDFAAQPSAELMKLLTSKN